MKNGGSAKSNRINIKNPVVCLLTSDTEGGTTYGEVEGLGEAMQIQLTPAVASGVLYGNGVQTENIGKLSGIAVSLDVNKLYIEKRALILGNEYKDGVLVEIAGQEPPYIALGYEVEQTNGTRELVWLLNRRAPPVNETRQQTTDNIVFSTDSITINFLPRDSDHQIRFFGDTANPDFTKEQADRFFLTGPTEYPKKTVQEPIQGGTDENN